MNYLIAPGVIMERKEKDIITEVISHFNITESELRITRQPFSLYRFITIYFMKRSGCSYREIKNYFNYDSHASVRYAEKKIEEWMSYDKKLIESINLIGERINQKKNVLAD
jgi:chromosomal replication initiation ATPase DnaA